MDYAELAAALSERADELLAPERAGHSRRVAELAAELCRREGLDPERGRAAGLAHDLCKELPRDEQRSLAALYPRAEPGSALMQDKIAHGPAAASLLARDYGVEDEELLAAVANHTVGRVGMGRLEAVVYCADKLEPGREKPGRSFRERCLSLPLEPMLVAVVGGVIGWMRERGKAVAPETLILYSSLAPGADPE